MRHRDPMSVNYIPSRAAQEPKQRQEQSWPSPPDPGDLSKRAARRRAELHLSKEQVAARAGMSLRYLEYLERYPARPGGAALRRLAAGTEVPAGWSRLAPPPH